MEGLRVLITDLDGTLLGDDEALARFAAWFEARCDRWRLVYNSGRFFGSVVEAVRATALPPPDAVIGGVGTEIRRYPRGHPLVEDWPGVTDCWNLPTLRAVLSAFDELEPQAEQYQAPYKLSYHGYDLRAARLDAMRRRLESAGQRANLVYSSSRDLDVLPEGVNKGSAAARLAALWQFEPWQVLVAGDTGNDASMYAQGFRGIVVANAQAELKRIASPTIYHSSRPLADGVLEGVEFWFPERKRPRTVALA